MHPSVCVFARLSRKMALRCCLISCALALIGLAIFLVPTALQAQGQEYVVQPNDTWSSVAARFSVSVADLQAANPQAVRPNRWLYVGEKLSIPGGSAPAPETQTTTYVVRYGDGWIVIARKFGIPVQQLRAANPQYIRPGDILYQGDQLTIPLPASAEAPATPVSEDTTPEGVATALVVTNTGSITTAVVSPTQTITPTTVAATATVTPTSPPPTETATASPTAEPITPTVSIDLTPTAEVSRTTALTTTTALTATNGAAAIPAGCPNNFAGYPDALAAALTASDGKDALAALLQTCGASVEDGVQAADWTGDGKEDLVVIYANPQSPSAQRQTDLIVFDSTANGFTQGYRAKAAGEVTLLATKDINQDKQPDIVWSDKTCGASTCFETVEVISWTGAHWSDWTDGAISMAYAEISLKEMTTEGQGSEIVLEGGVYGSEGAGPQRSRTELWGSKKGAPYTLLSRTYAESKCLYHTVLDANEAYLNATRDGLGRAELLYTQAATDQTLEKCGARENELSELRSFSLFRLALVAAYEGNPGVAADVIGSLSKSYPGSAYDQVGQAWLTGYQKNNDMAAACSAVDQVIEKNPAAVEILADYGYANPSFKASDVCPLLKLAVAKPTTTSADQTPTAPITATVAATPQPTKSSSVATPVATKPATSAAITSTAALSLTSGLPACPADLNGYADLLPSVLTASGGDTLIIETWLRQCNAMSDDRGGFTLVDANGDGRQDAIFWPTVISDLGFGPKGTQGDVLVYHSQADGSYQLVGNEEIYGQPTLLAAEDLNADGKVDLAWQVIGCSTFCVLEAQIVTWDGKVYTPTIRPGATIAEGTAAFEPIDSADPGQGKQLVLTGGVSGTPEGGLSVPHTEVWQSVKGAAFQRIRWTYDRKTDGNDCLGLRLIEADVALQASPVLGYKPAIDLYTQSINPTLKACSVYGMAAADELKLLQGLASFRLIQAETLSGNTQAAHSDLDSLTKGQPDGLYTQAATEWVAAYEKTPDAKAACQAIQSIFTKNEKLWQITDHFGYNHPPLAAEQLCYAP